MHDMGWGWGILMTLGWLALLGVFVVVLFAAVRDRRNTSAREILDRRLAAGEINLDDYERARVAMARDSSDRSPAGPPAPA
jgi:putative membrane protein